MKLLLAILLTIPSFQERESGYYYKHPVKVDTIYMAQIQGDTLMIDTRK